MVICRDLNRQKSMIVLLLAIGFVMVLLISRFVQPELIYGFRRVVTKVMVNKAFLDFDAGRSGCNRLFNEQLLNDFRFETQEHDEKYALQRVIKIREWYRIQNSQKAVTAEETKELNTQQCI